MIITVCLEFEGVDSNSEVADEIVDHVTVACKDLQAQFGADSCWVDDAQDDGWYRVERFYGADHGWDNYYTDTNELFDTEQEALERYWEDELEEGASLATLVLPEDIRIVRISNS